MERTIRGCQNYKHLYQIRGKLKKFQFQKGKVTRVSCGRFSQALYQLETRHFSWIGSQANDERDGRRLGQDQNQETVWHHQRFQITWPGKKNLFAVKKAWLRMGWNAVLIAHHYQEAIVRREHRFERAAQWGRGSEPRGEDQFAFEYQKQCF